MKNPNAKYFVTSTRYTLNPFLFLDRSYIKLQLLRACKSADVQEKVSKANKENWMKVQSIIVGEKINAFSFCIHLHINFLPASHPAQA